MPNTSISADLPGPVPGNSLTGQCLMWMGTGWALTDTAPGAGGGSDPWTYLKLAADVTTTSSTAVDVVGLSFTPAPNTTYEVRGTFLLRTNTATVGPRTGVAWPTGLTDGVARLTVTSAAGTMVTAQGNITAAVLAPVGGLPTTTGSWPGDLHATFRSGASPSGTFKVQLASETAGTTVTVKAHSWIGYRII